jgi:hypothetical protein
MTKVSCTSPDLCVVVGGTVEAKKKKKMSAVLFGFALLATLTVVMPSPTLVGREGPTISPESLAPLTSLTPDHASFSALHSALLGSALLPFPLPFSQGVPSDRTDLDWLTGWLEKRYATTRLLVEIAKRIDIDGVGRGVAGNGTSEQGKII